MSTKHWIIILVGAAMLIGALARLRNTCQLSQQIESCRSIRIASIFSKSCGVCGRQVPESSKAGEYCPHCGVYWSDENTTEKTQENGGGGRSDTPQNDDMQRAVANYYSDMASTIPVTVGALVLLAIIAAIALHDRRAARP